MKAKYCKCKNTYTINNCDCENVPYYWGQGIGSLIGQGERFIPIDIFDETFDETFN
jgi:hypothetical protein